ncbi:mitochondrial carrier domain-containing protein [Lentinula aff. detonsa]|uniref:Mitochondrial carrier domain-containing protein n=1 Tax=Lentinula aff. detonsa TaxID=2804958 RepID=A0AA38KKL6_9AGAR|nr:mitochondrial carrier domain-containing protein [Lentinula aff. detonsa]
MPAEKSSVHFRITGTTAGALEAFITYPTEFVKTRSQNRSRNLKTKGVLGLYSGCTALVLGNAVIAGVRFISYDHFKSVLANAEGKVSAPRSLVAGLGAGMVEAIFAVTPSETIKTKLIDDANRPKPQYCDLVHGSVTIVRQEGLAGIYRGLLPVMMRQGANSAVRFTTYSTLKRFVQGTARPGQTLPSAITFASIGAIAGLDLFFVSSVIKTRMQSLSAHSQYRNSFHCEEGVRRFWTGTTPRLVKLVMSGGIVFTVYENVMGVLKAIES